GGARGAVGKTAEGFLRGAERGGVRGRAGEHAHHRGDVLLEEPCEQDGQDAAGEDDGGGENVDAEAFLPEGGNEAGTHLHPDRVHEEDQAELTDEFERGPLDAESEVSEYDAGEEDAGGSEGDAADLEASECEPGDGHQAQRENRAGDRMAGLELLEYGHSLRR